MGKLCNNSTLSYSLLTA